jgi:hypothetical protein
MNIEEIKTEALCLDAKERAALSRELLVSLGGISESEIEKCIRSAGDSFTPLPAACHEPFPVVAAKGLTTG